MRLFLLILIFFGGPSLADSGKVYQASDSSILKYMQRDLDVSSHWYGAYYTDPDGVDFVVPGNDDAIRSIGLLTRVITDAIAAGLAARSAQAKSEVKDEAPAVAAGEPLADWEKEIAGTTEVSPEAITVTEGA